jgi:hypothetical protein
VGEERGTGKQDDLILALVLVLVLLLVLLVVLVIFVVVLLLLPQVSLSGCPGSEDDDGQMLTLVTAKLKFRSSSYRLVGGKVEMGNGTSRVSQAAPNISSVWWLLAVVMGNAGIWSYLSTNGSPLNTQYGLLNPGRGAAPA